MSSLVENLIVALWNRQKRRQRRPDRIGVNLGWAVSDGLVTSRRVMIPHGERTKQIAIVGRTGSGKSSLVKSMAEQDVRQGNGWIYFDLHGDSEDFLLRAITAEERHRGEDLSHKLIRVAPGDQQDSVGINVLEKRAGQNSFIQIAEFTQILKRHWHLDSFGAQTEELLRNSLHVLSETGLTIIELAPLLANATFRAKCLERVSNQAIRAYFEQRYDTSSPAMQAVMRNPILNKVSLFTIDPQFRHLLGQQRSTFDFVRAMDQGCWVILNLSKAELGEQAQVVAGLLLAKIKNALFSRRSRNLCTLYCDEVQNLVASDSGLEVLLSEARKFGVSVVSANQFLDQLPPLMRSALMSVQTHILFRLSSADAEKMATALDGGRALSTLLRSLPTRHAVVQSVENRWQEVAVANLATPNVSTADLLKRSQQRWAKSRAEIEAEIQSRQPADMARTPEIPDDWE